MEIYELDSYYLSAIAATVTDLGLLAVNQKGDSVSSKGRLFLQANAAEPPAAVVYYSFNEQHVELGVEMRNDTGLELPWIAKRVAYAEGLGEFLRDLRKVLKSRRLEAA